MPDFIWSRRLKNLLIMPQPMTLPSMADQAAIHVNYRLIDGYHVYTSDDVYGLYVANTDAQAAYDAVAPSLERLVKLNEKIDCHVEPAMTFGQAAEAGGGDCPGCDAA